MNTDETKDTAMDAKQERNLLILIINAAILDIKEEILTLNEMNARFIRDFIKKKHKINMNKDLRLIEECLEEARAVDILSDMGYDFKASLMLRIAQQNKRLMDKLEARDKEYEEMHAIMAKYREETFKLRRIANTEMPKTGENTTETTAIQE